MSEAVTAPKVRRITNGLSQNRRTLHPLYMVLASLAEALIIALTLLPLLTLQAHFGLELLSSALLFFPIFWIVSLVAHALVRKLVPIRPGRYLPGTQLRRRWAWEFLGFLTIMNLHLLLLGPLVPPMWRGWLYRMLGAHVGSGLVVIGGYIHDPFLVRVGDQSLLGLDCLLLPHALTSKNELLLAPIHVGKGVVIGARAMIMPGVTIGEGAMVESMSFVPAFTKIGPGEVWGGHPAKLRKAQQ
ncbi:MAG: hypothetical protein JRH20_08295 [Deltaproteobacteria bacterium]|nr:hypothetical protein [Deltaproteobacteria bacterium]